MQPNMTVFDDKAFQATVKSAKERWELPTVCISLSADAESSVTRWFGCPSSGPADKDSIIPMASNTKFFTAVGLAILVEEGKLKWTDRITDLVAGLKLVDEETTRVLTLEDILSHRSGMPSCIEAESSRELWVSDAVEVVNAVRPTEPALKVYQYNNACWDLAGHIISKLSGQPYADFIEQRILKPLGMLSSSHGTPEHPEKQVSAAVAIPGHGSQDIEALCLTRETLCAPGGGLLSTPDDMSIWLRYLTRLYNDKLSADEPRIIKTSTLKEMLRSRSLAGHQIGGVPTQPGESLFKEMSVPTYALGQYRAHYRGMDMVYHWGHITGGGSVTLWLPEENFSLMVWSNVANAACGAAPAIALMALDAHFGFEAVGWTERFWTLPSGRPDVPMPPKDSKPDLSALDRYTGTFWAPAYGQLHIFRPNAHPADLPQSAALKLGLIKKARVFGPATERQPDLLAVYENSPFVIGYVVMYAVGSSTFWSQYNELADLSRVSTAETDDVVAMPHSVKTFEAVGVDTWEFARMWQETQLEKGKGSATFKRISGNVA